MSTAGNLITQAQNYADDAVDLAQSKIVDYLSQIMSLTDAFQFLSNIPITEYMSIGGSVASLLTKLTGNPDDFKLPVKNEDIGDYNLSDPPTFNAVDTSFLRERVYDIINVIDTIPDRISEALVVIDAVSSKILGDLLSGGYGIDVNDELHLYERARDKELLLANDAIEELKKQFTAYGIPIPSGSYNELLEKALEKSFDTLSNFNRDIYSKRAELFRAARNFAIEKGIEIGKEQLGITDVKVKALISAARAAYETLSLQVENHKEKLAVYNAQLFMTFENQKVLLEEYKTDVDLWKGKLDGIVHVAAVSTESFKSQLEADRLELEQRVEKAKAQILAFNAEINARTAAIQAVLQMYSQQVAGALSSITAVAAEIAQEGG